MFSKLVEATGGGGDAETDADAAGLGRLADQTVRAIEAPIAKTITTNNAGFSETKLNDRGITGCNEGSVKLVSSVRVGVGRCVGPEEVTGACVGLDFGGTTTMVGVYCLVSSIS